MSAPPSNPQTSPPNDAERATCCAGEKQPSAAVLAHEGRNALQRSQACLEMLALEVQNQPTASDLVRRVQIAQDQLARLYEEVVSLLPEE
jgi:hypothetical protein